MTFVAIDNLPYGIHMNILIECAECQAINIITYVGIDCRHTRAYMYVAGSL